MRRVYGDERDGLRGLEGFAWNFGSAAGIGKERWRVCEVVSSGRLGDYVFLKK